MRTPYPFTPLPQGWCRRAVQANLSPGALRLALVVAEETLRQSPDRKKVLATGRLAKLLGLSRRWLYLARIEAAKAGLIAYESPGHRKSATYWIPLDIENESESVEA